MRSDLSVLRFGKSRNFSFHSREKPGASAIERKRQREIQFAAFNRERRIHFGNRVLLKEISTKKEQRGEK